MSKTLRRITTKDISKIAAIYDKVAKAFEIGNSVWISPVVLRLIRDYVQEQGLNDFSVIDLGGGTGAIGTGILTTFPSSRYHLLDISINMCKLASSHLIKKFNDRADIRNTNFREVTPAVADLKHSGDIILAIGAGDGVGRNEYAQHLRQIFYYAKPNALVIVVEFHAKNEHDIGKYRSTEVIEHAKSPLGDLYKSVGLPEYTAQKEIFKIIVNPLLLRHVISFAMIMHKKHSYQKYNELVLRPELSDIQEFTRATNTKLLLPEFGTNTPAFYYLKLNEASAEYVSHHHENVDLL